MTEEPYRIADGITLEKQCGIPVYCAHPNRFQTVEHSVITTWIEHVLEQIKAHPVPHLVPVVYDLSRISILRLNMTGQYDTASLGLTVEGNQAVERLFQGHPDLQLYLAVVMSPTLSAKMTRTIAPKAVPYKRRFFGTLSAALTWLQATTTELPRSTQIAAPIERKP
jgi:hypothetical protein